jgi:hypothetical protein
MWVPSSVLSWFQISKDTVDALREANASLSAERDALVRELTSVKITCDWLRLQFNQLQLERTALIEKVYNIKLPAPELVKAPTITSPSADFNFDDMGDQLAKQFGYPSYGDKQ